MKHYLEKLEKYFHLHADTKPKVNQQTIGRCPSPLSFVQII